MTKIMQVDAPRFAGQPRVLGGSESHDTHGLHGSSEEGEVEVEVGAQRPDEEVHIESMGEEGASAQEEDRPR